MSVGEGKIRIQLNVVEGTERLLDQAMDRIRQEAEAAGEEPPFEDRGTFVTWLAEKVLDIASAEEKAVRLLAAAEKDREEARRLRETYERELAERQRALDRAEQDLMEADAELRRQVGLSKWALGLLADLGAQGMSRDDVLAVARLIRASGLDPDQVAKAMEREDIQGLAGWAARLRQTTVAMADEYQRLAEETAAMRKALAMLREEAEKHAQAVEQAKAEIRAAAVYADRIRRTADELGIYLQAIGSAGMRVEDLPEGTARVLAGVLLLASLDAHGDTVLPLPANPALRRMLPVEVALSELPYVLAPREAYARLRDEQIRRAVRAEGLATEGMATDGPPNGHAKDSQAATTRPVVS